MKKETGPQKEIIKKERITPLFTRRELWAMILPLFAEQFLVILVGMADTLIISYAGETAVSGVSLVNQFNTIFIYLFTALASGGAVVISQYLGSGSPASAGKASSQLFSFSVLFSLLISLLVLFGNEAMLGLLFGGVEREVMDACIIYLRISAYSYPMLAIYNAGASLYRSLGKTQTTMYISIVSNVVNVIGNCIGVFLLHAGVAGVAWPSFIARTLSALWITLLCFSRTREVHYEIRNIFTFDMDLLKKMLGIAIPNGIESGIFQFVKVALSSIVALFGTYQIAANGIAQSIWSMAALSSVAMGPVFITVIGRCMGNHDTDSAEFYFHDLLKINIGLSVFWNGLILALTPLFLRFYAVSEETSRLIFLLVLLHNIFNSFALPLSGSLSSGLRAAGDVRFTMLTSIFTTVCIRLVFSYIFAQLLGMGVMGIAWAMCMDWTVRGAMQYSRLRRGSWKAFRVI